MSKEDELEDEEDDEEEGGEAGKAFMCPV